jgi:hypothetical protein
LHQSYFDCNKNEDVDTGVRVKAFVGNTYIYFIERVLNEELPFDEVNYRESIYLAYVFFLMLFKLRLKNPLL